MAKEDWTIIDTETTGFSSPIFVLDIAAQRMRGLEPIGDPFQVYINHDVEIPYAARKVHGITKDFLSVHGVPPLEAYRLFEDYVQGSPLASYNLAYDFDRVLEPEWQRIGHFTEAYRGFCVLELARRLLNPSPAGNYKLQSLKDHYSLPDRQAHSALGDVNTIIDLLTVVLKGPSERRGLTTYELLSQYTEYGWMPSIIHFGEFCGRHLTDALFDQEMMAWVHSISNDADRETREMGAYYIRTLRQLSESIVGTVKVPTTS